MVVRWQKKTGALYCLHESNQGRVKFPFHALSDGEIIEVGNVEVKVMHTPGHTPDSICLTVADKRRSTDPWFILTGDTLFVGSVGRPDLAGKGEEWAGQLFDTLHTKLMSLPNDVEIFPGHTSGSACGAGISGKPSSTVGFEKRSNTGLKFTNKSEFVRTARSFVRSFSQTGASAGNLKPSCIPSSEPAGRRSPSLCAPVAHGC